MATHQEKTRYELQSSQGNSSSGGNHGANSGEDEMASELDEPPECHVEMIFSKLPQPSPQSPFHYQAQTTSFHNGKASLLTQAFLTSPELTPISDSDAPQNTSDGGITCPTKTTTPISSPPITFPTSDLPPFVTKASPLSLTEQVLETSQLPHPAVSEYKQTNNLEETLGRKRCISFACGSRQAQPEASIAENKMPENTGGLDNCQIPPQRRPCLLRFACTTKPSSTKPLVGRNVLESPQPSKSPSPRSLTQDSTTAAAARSALTAFDAHHTAVQNPKPCSLKPNETALPDLLAKSQFKKPFNRVDFQKSEATRFHAFASPYQEEDEWTHEQTAYRQRITINDTLHKENAIRRLAREAEEEALEEEVGLAENDEVSDNDDDIYDSPDDDGDLIGWSDDGNESDDEGGFAESDGGSDEGFGYHFWTPGLTTAATSMEHLEHIRPLTERMASGSSIESASKIDLEDSGREAIEQHTKSILQRKRHKIVPRKRSMTVRDFIIGTLDEDRSLQEAYMSSLEERKRSRQRLIPQDIDPSFPTSDPEAENEGNESEDEDAAESPTESSNLENMSHSSFRAAEDLRNRHEQPSERLDNGARVSSKRLHSPPPGRLFGHASRRLRSPPPPSKRVASPPPSRRPSPLASSVTGNRQAFVVHRLAQRPNLTRTASLPRSANPFWDQHRPPASDPSRMTTKDTNFHVKKGTDAELHTRGPIDIVLGLEHKRQRRREKFWRLHCQKAHAGKEKERKCQPGKGAQRMREVGKEMQDRLRGYGHNRPNLMLSI